MDNYIQDLRREALNGGPEEMAKLKRACERANILPPRTMVVDGERVTVDDIFTSYENGMTLVEVICEDESSMELFVSKDQETAGRQARQYWSEMVEHDPEEFTHIVGTDALVAWALGRPHAPGLVAVSSLEEWLDLSLDHPHEHFASYDGEERDVERVSEDLIAELGFTPTVAYRHN